MGILNNGRSKPYGLTHHTKDYASFKIPHWIIIEHQKAFPELGEKMKYNPINATNIYIAFMNIMLLKAKHLLTDDLKIRILKEYKVMK